jgi:bacteriorhodopsin
MASMSHTPHAPCETAAAERAASWIVVIMATAIVVILGAVAFGFYELVRLVDPVYYAIGIVFVILAPVFYKLMPAPIVINLIPRDKNSNRR